MKVIFLAGGYGTRLSEETNIIPKPMIEIGGKPLLWHLMKHFSCYDKSKFIVALGYKGEVIKDYFMRYPQLHSDLKINLESGKVDTLERFSENWEIELIDTGPTTMTGGRLKRLRDSIDGTFIFTYGDGLSNIDITELVKFHKSHGKLATVTAVTPTQRFGLLKLDNDGIVQSFSEKPDYKNESINGGFFVLEPEVIDYIDGDDSVWEKEPCERLAADGQLMAYRHNGFWQCVDTLHELRLLRDLWASGSAEWKKWT
jgi:glucose-1-phosphate cytidylyltransferase